jgi:hypothetical protein
VVDITGLAEVAKGERLVLEAVTGHQSDVSSSRHMPRSEWSSCNILGGRSKVKHSQEGRLMNEFAGEAEGDPR